MNFKNELTPKEIEYLLSLVESDYEEVALYVDSKELEKDYKFIGNFTKEKGLLYLKKN